MTSHHRLNRYPWTRLLCGAFTSLLVVSAPFLFSPNAHAIAYGEDVPDGKYTFATALSMPEMPRKDGTSYASACSGALIAEWWIVSAGHCFRDEDGERMSGVLPYPVIATIGRATRSGTDGHDVEVVEVVQHPDTDLAVARLAVPVTDVEPLALADAPPEPGDIVRLVGWGTTDGTARLSHRPDRMQTGQMTVTTLKKHEVYVTGYAPHRNTSACPYDSGAPYFSETGTQPRLVGVEVDGPACPHDKDEEAARVDVVADWIRTTISR